MKWFDVDKSGLSKIMSRKEKHFVLFELIQNAWDENSSEVFVTVDKPKNSQFVDIVVKDNNPEGFKNLEHSFTLFAESEKKSNPKQRGRFNIGEKLVLSMCKEATIKTTKGTVFFGDNGRIKKREKTEIGTIFSAKLKMTTQEMENMLEKTSILIPPSDIKTFINNKILVTKTPIKSFNMSLPTEISDIEGNLKRTKRKTDVEIYESENGSYIYEMGIPIVKIEDKFSINVLQKVPLNLERDNVTPKYLKDLRAEVLNHTNELINEEEASSLWIQDALENESISKESIEKIIKKRFGEKIVSYDPTDLESNKKAVANGYQVLHGRQLTKAQWNNVRKHDLVNSSSSMFPTPKPFSDDPNAKSLKIIKKQDYTEKQKTLHSNLKDIAMFITGKSINLKFANDHKWGFGGSFAKDSREMIINLSGHKNKEEITEKILDVFIHELGHLYESDHLSDNYYRALTKIGSKMAVYFSKNNIHINVD